MIQFVFKCAVSLMVLLTVLVLWSEVSISVEPSFSISIPDESVVIIIALSGLLALVTGISDAGRRIAEAIKVRNDVKDEKPEDG